MFIKLFLSISIVTLKKQIFLNSNLNIVLQFLMQNVKKIKNFNYLFGYLMSCSTFLALEGKEELLVQNVDAHICVKF